EADQVDLVEQTTEADVALSDSAESAIDNLAVAVVEASQAQTANDAPATANAIAASAQAEADAIGGDAQAQAAHTAEAASVAMGFLIAKAHANQQFDLSVAAAGVAYSNTVPPILQSQPADAQQQIRAAQDTYNTSLLNAQILHASQIGDANVAQAGA